MTLILGSSKQVDEVSKLVKDPIVIAMADEIPMEELEGWSHDGEVPSFEFIMVCNSEYRWRGGKDEERVGSVALAILKIKKMPHSKTRHPDCGCDECLGRKPAHA